MKAGKKCERLLQSRKDGKKQKIWPPAIVESAMRGEATAANGA